MFRHNADSCLEWGTFLILEWFIQSVLVSGWTKKKILKSIWVMSTTSPQPWSSTWTGLQNEYKKISQCPKKIVETVRKTRELKELRKSGWGGGKLQKGSEHKHKTTMSGQLLHLHGIKKKNPSTWNRKIWKKNIQLKKNQQSWIINLWNWIWRG